MIGSDFYHFLCLKYNMKRFFLKQENKGNRIKMMFRLNASVLVATFDAVFHI